MSNILNPGDMVAFKDSQVTGPVEVTLSWQTGILLKVNGDMSEVSVNGVAVEVPTKWCKKLLLEVPEVPKEKRIL